MHLDMKLDRRMLLGSALLGLAASSWPVSSASAQDQNLFRITGDDGKPVTNYRVPSQLSIDGLPGIIWAGARDGDVLLVEFHDYNCPYCRKASADIDVMIKKDRKLRLALVNNAQLSPGSILAAKVEQAVLKFYGPVRAYEFHRKMFERRGSHDGRSALQVAKAMGLDIARLEAEADSEIITSVLTRQKKLADALALVATPSFILASTGMLGYPGPRALAAMIAAVRKCDKPVC